MRLILSPEAQDDINDILLYTLQMWGEEQLDQYAAQIDKGLSLITDSPGIGRSQPQLYADCRSYRIREHIVYYAVKGNDINVARVLHVRMDAKRHF
jgi:toxin ParE1/3/4